MINHRECVNINIHFIVIACPILQSVKINFRKNGNNDKNTKINSSEKELIYSIL